MHVPTGLPAPAVAPFLVDTTTWSPGPDGPARVELMAAEALDDDRARLAGAGDGHGPVAGRGADAHRGAVHRGVERAARRLAGRPVVQPMSTPASGGRSSAAGSRSPSCAARRRGHGVAAVRRDLRQLAAGEPRVELLAAVPVDDQLRVAEAADRAAVRSCRPRRSARAGSGPGPCRRAWARPGRPAASGRGRTAARARSCRRPSSRSRRGS